MIAIIYEVTRLSQLITRKEILIKLIRAECIFLCCHLPYFVVVWTFINENSVFLPIVIKQKGFKTEFFEFLGLKLSSIQ